MKRRTFITLLGGAATWPLNARAQQSTRMPRLGVLSPFFPADGPSPSFEAFRQRLRDLGWREGANIAFDYRWAEGRAARLPELAADLVRLKVDVIFSAYGTPAALAAKNATATVPIVFAGVGDALGVGVVASLARPGGNITGSTFITEETIAKQLELLKEAVPTLSRVAVLVNPTNPVYGPVLKATEVPARALRLQLQNLGVEGRGDFEGALDAAAKERAEGLVALRDSVIITNRSHLVELVARRRLPTMYAMREFVEDGGLMSHGPKLTDMYQRAAHVVDRVLRGANPSDIPVERATRFEFVINLKTAKALGLTISDKLLVAADEVIE